MNKIGLKTVRLNTKTLERKITGLCKVSLTVSNEIDAYQAQKFFSRVLDLESRGRFKDISKVER